MAKIPVSSKNQMVLHNLSSKRKRALVNEDAEGYGQANKKHCSVPQITDHCGDDEDGDDDDGDEQDDDDDDDASLNSDVEFSSADSDNEEGIEEIDDEPAQDTILWSEDQEEYPSCAVYHEDVKPYQNRITDLAVNVTEQLSEICCRGGDMAKFHAEAITIQRFPELKKIVIALMGEAGSGKSSLINSILDTPHIAKEGNYGSACTCAITEFMDDFPEQTKKFAAKITFLDATQRRKLLQDHLRGYAYFYFEKDNDWTPDEKMEYHAQAQTAEGTFLDLFRGKPSFKNRKELKAYIRSAYDNDAGAVVVAQMETWAEELITAHASSSQLRVIQSDRAFRLRRLLSPFLSSSNSARRQPRLWPLVSKVSIGIKGCRVLANLIIADMPALNDLNRSRVMVSKKYLRDSDELWVVTAVGRCISDTTVDHILCEFGERFAGHLTMICTKIDDPMKSDAFKAEYPNAAKKLERIEKAYKEANEDYTDAKAQVRAATRPSTLEKRNIKVETCRQEKERLANIRLNFMVRTRNHMIAKQIYEDKSEFFEEDVGCSVFFVSNEHYMWLKGYKESGGEDALPQLSVELTGILALREHALSIPAQSMWLNLMSHIQHTNIAFMKSLAIWAARTGADYGDELRSINEKSTKGIDQYISAYVKAVEKDAVQSLAVTMRDTLDDVAQKAYVYFNGTVRLWPWNTIRAVVAREGTFTSRYSRTVKSVNWNEKLKYPTSEYLTPEWDELFSKEKENMGTTKDRMQSNLDTLCYSLEEMMQLYNIPMGEFGDLIEAQKHGITRAVQIASGHIEKELRNTRQLTEKDMSYGYFAQAMRPTYEQAAQITGKSMFGTGYKNKVMTVFEDVVNQRTHESPFIRMADYAANKVAHHATISAKELQKKCHDIYDEIFNQFGGLMVNAEDNDEDVAAVKTALREYLPTIDAEMADIISKLKAIEKNPNLKTSTQSKTKVKKEEKQQDRKTKVKTEVKHEQSW
ncbi:hypothetical protein QM012_002838 [Aureobasidium pullulans]|uniref:DUF7605 domain-containing protein n=1 Tax=Aureobasidium pullulans TaxID=5580 RepID=A0ABR0TBK3_AURPU